MNVGERIRTLRRSAGMTQEDLSKLVGVTRSAVAIWETQNPKHQRKPNGRSLEAIAVALNVTVSDLFAENEQQLQPLKHKDVAGSTQTPLTHFDLGVLWASSSNNPIKFGKLVQSAVLERIGLNSKKGNADAAV